MPDELLREIKVRAARENRRLKELVPDLLRAGLRAAHADPRAQGRTRPIELPLFKGAPNAPARKMSTDEIQALIDRAENQDVETHARSAR